MKVSEALADALAAEADGPIFGLMGDANMAVWGALTADSRVRMIASRHDGAAVLMADGYSKSTGHLGVATVTCGPGLSNCATALLSAARAQTPLLVFTGEYDARGKGAVQALDQKKFASSCEAQFISLSKLDSLAEDVSEAFYAARTSNCPVVLNLPSEHWDAELKWDWDYRPSLEFIAAHRQAPQPEVLTLLLDELMKAERPVFVAGRGALLSNAQSEIIAVADRVGALLATTLVAKGFFDGHPFDLGICGSFSSAPTEALMAHADLVVGFGASLNLFTTEGGLLFPTAKVARIDVKPCPSAIGQVPGLYLQGDAKQTAIELLAALERKGPTKTGFRSDETRAAFNAPTTPAPRSADGLDPRELMRALGLSLPAKTQIVLGGGHFWSWPIVHLALPAGGRLIHTSAFGSIGLGLSQGIGAAVGAPERVTMVVEGDGGLLQSIQELHSAAQIGLPLIVLVLNDSGYGAEIHKMRLRGLDPKDAQWRSPDFVGIARCFGGDGVRLEKETDIGSAIDMALKVKGPFVIDARISPTTISDAYSRMYFGKINQAPLLRPLRQG